MSPKSPKKVSETEGKLSEADVLADAPQEAVTHLDEAPQKPTAAEPSSHSGRSSPEKATAPEKATTPEKATAAKPMDRHQIPCLGCIEHLISWLPTDEGVMFCEEGTC